MSKIGPKSVYDGDDGESMYAPTSSDESEGLDRFYPDENEDLSDQQESGHQSPAKSGAEWSADDQLLLLRNIRKQIPKRDKLPFHERLKKIVWEHAKKNLENRSNIDNQSKFMEILSSSRQFRLLDEIIKEKQREMCPKLSVPRPVPAFLLYMRDHKDKIVRDKNKFGKYTQAASESFKKCSEEERRRYKDKAANLKKNYREALVKYGLTDFISGQGNKGLPSFKDLPVKAFIRMKKLEDINLSQLDARKQYLSLDKTEKLKLLLQWLDLENGCKRNMEQLTRCQENLSKSEIKIIDEYEGRPLKHTGYSIFLREYFDNASSKNISQSSLLIAASRCWKDMSNEAKEEYFNGAKIYNDEFTANVVRFVASLPTDRQEYEINFLLAPKGKKSRKRSDKLGNNSVLVESGIKRENTDSDLDDDADAETIFQCDTICEQQTNESPAGVIEKKKENRLSKPVASSSKISISQKKRKTKSQHDSDQTPAKSFLTQSSSKSAARELKDKKKLSTSSQNTIVKSTSVASSQKKSNVMQVNSDQDVTSDLNDDEDETNFQCQQTDESDGVMEKKEKLFSKEIESSPTFSISRKKRTISQSGSDQLLTSPPLSQSSSKSTARNLSSKKMISKSSQETIVKSTSVASPQKKSNVMQANGDQDVTSDLNDDEDETNFQCQQNDESDGVVEKKGKLFSKQIESSPTFSISQKKRTISQSGSDQLLASPPLSQSSSKSAARNLSSKKMIPKSSHNTIIKSTPVKSSQKKSNINHGMGEQNVGSELHDDEINKTVQCQTTRLSQQTSESDDSVMNKKKVLPTSVTSPELSSSPQKRRTISNDDGSEQSPAIQILNESPSKKKHKKRKLSDNLMPLQSSYSSVEESSSAKRPQKKSDEPKSTRTRAEAEEYFNSPIAYKISKDAREKYEKLSAKKPPNDVVDYYAQQYFKGSQKEARKSFRHISESDREQINMIFQKAKRKYEKKFKKFGETITPFELSVIQAHLDAGQTD